MDKIGPECAGYVPIADYAVIGNCRTAALVSRSGSIDWYCPGRFDAAAVFCRVLDAKRGGYFQIEPAGEFTSSRTYLDDTNILITTHRSSHAEITVTDFMPVPAGGPDGIEDGSGDDMIVRRVEAVRGATGIVVSFRPTFNYARGETRVEAVPDSGALACGSDGYLALSCPGLQVREDAVCEAVLHLHEGEHLTLRLIAAPTREAALRGLLASSGTEEHDLEETRQFWERWAAQCTYHGPYRRAVMRSALALKLLIYEPSGAIVAAPTTSLPEQLGGVRNWDYRYTWLRDSSFILYALLTIGYDHAAVQFLRWLRGVVQRDMPAKPQIMYGVDGRRDLPEVILERLDGYCHSRPVRIGNAAAGQTQVDIYGEVLIAAYIHYSGASDIGAASGNRRAPVQGPDESAWRTLRTLVDDAVQVWREPDNGIWEVRAGPQQFVYSKLMCWAAVDRGIRLAQDFDLPAGLERWKSARTEIRQAIEERGYNAKLGAFVQTFDGDLLDAAVLVISRIGFLSPTDPRVLSTLDVIQRDLMLNGLVYRYRGLDGLPAGEGAFLLCTFWLVEALALAGQIDKARALFEHALSFNNDVGLFSEEIDPVTGGFLGNFPQGFTHLSLIRAAADLALGAKRGPGVQAQREDERIPQAHRAATEGHG